MPTPVVMYGGEGQACGARWPIVREKEIRFVMPSRRRRLIVDRSRQLALVKAIVAPGAICVVVGFLVGSWFLGGVMEDLGESERRAHWISWILGGGLFVGVVVAVLLYQALHLSHRIAGPAYRIRHDLRRVMAGDRSHRISLRRGDWLDDVAHESNLFLDWVEKTHSSAVTPGGSPSGESAERAPSPEIR
ncbi:MAG: hypothetical protein KDB80_11665 [Planctomycetes bacterium]|nr:hypothetical protein [Planctomycetota bacterium]